MNMVIVTMTLGSLRDFLDHVSADAGHELESIEERAQNGAFDTDDSYEAALSRPWQRLEIAARAELVALVERELQQLAYDPWLHSPEHKGPKTLFDLNRDDVKALSTLKSVSDLRFEVIVPLVEDHYRLTLAALPNWSEVATLRDAVNAFKHNNGFKRFRKIDWTSDTSWPQQHETSVDGAYAQMDAVRTFLVGLNSAVFSPQSVRSQ